MDEVLQNNGARLLGAKPDSLPPLLLQPGTSQSVPAIFLPSAGMAGYRLPSLSAGEPSKKPGAGRRWLHPAILPPLGDEGKGTGWQV